MEGSRTAKSNPEGTAAFQVMLISFSDNRPFQTSSLSAWSYICGGTKKKDFYHRISGKITEIRCLTDKFQSCPAPSSLCSKCLPFSSSSCVLQITPHPIGSFPVYKPFKSTFTEAPDSSRFCFPFISFYKFVLNTSNVPGILSPYFLKKPSVKLLIFPYSHVSRYLKVAKQLKKLILNPFMTIIKLNITSFVKFSLLSAFKTSYSHDASFSTDLLLWILFVYLPFKKSWCSPKLYLRLSSHSAHSLGRS